MTDLYKMTVKGFYATKFGGEGQMLIRRVATPTTQAPRLSDEPRYSRVAGDLMKQVQAKGVAQGPRVGSLLAFTGCKPATF